MHQIYLVCLSVGLLFSVACFFLNGILDGLHFDIGLDFLGLPVKLSSIMVAASVFGGVGLITESFLGGLPFAIIGLIFSYYLFTYLFYELLPSYQTETKDKDAAIGMIAEVLVSILPDKMGKISYVIDGNTLSSLAREKNSGNGIKQGTKVKIMALDENEVFLVTVLKENELNSESGEVN